MEGVGENIKFSAIFCTSINSSKIRVTLSPLKLSAESPGSAFNKRGGNESLGPPSGGIIFAQPVPAVMLTTAINTIIMDVIIPFVFMRNANLAALRGMICF